MVSHRDFHHICMTLCIDTLCNLASWRDQLEVSPDPNNRVVQLLSVGASNISRLVDKYKEFP